jgi:hypothetical protein
MSFVTSIVVVELVALLILSLAVAGLIRQVRFLSRGVGATLTRKSPSTVDGFVGRSIGGLPELSTSDGRPSVVLFASGDCQICDERFSDLEAIAAIRGEIDFRIVLQGRSNRFNSPHIPVLQDRRDIFSSLGIPVTPFGISVDGEGTISEARPLGSAQAVTDLVATTKGALR